jgi:GTP-binding protein
MFVDEVILKLMAGDGGNGCLAYHREKFIEMGGPDGGNGGHGANIVFKVDEGLNTLLDLRAFKVIKGVKGENGQGKGMNGKNAEDVVIRVPAGTIISNKNGDILCDLVGKDDEAIVAHGGRGGRGNIALRTRTNKCPNYAENGEPGEEIEVKIELKLLADVGLVGLPSVGKSTIISKISAAKPKIAAYHFTTLHPNLGMVKTKDGRSFVVADMPGLIEGASLGEGLGDKFLKHIERTRVLAHVVDMSGIEGRSPIDDYNLIRDELGKFDSKLLDKPEIILANKMDMPDSEKNLKEFKKHIKKDVYQISAIKGEGLDPVLIKLADMLDTIKKEPLYEENKTKTHVIYKFQEEKPFEITHPSDHLWVVSGPKVEKLLKMTHFVTDESAEHFDYQLKQMGVNKALKDKGAMTGDTIRILDIEFEYKED